MDISGPIILGMLIGVVVGLLLQFLPIIIAMIKGSTNRGEVIILNLLVFGGGIVNGVVFGLLVPITVVQILISIGLFVLWIIALVKAIKG